MIYVNNILVTQEANKSVAGAVLKEFLIAEKLVVVKKENQPMSEQELNHALMNITEKLQLTAVRSSVLIREFKEELHSYNLRVEKYINDTRQSEDFTNITTSFVEVTEALLEFSTVSNYLQKEMINKELIQELSEKALQQVEVGNTEYLLDLMEYEILPILYHFIQETNEEM